MIWLLIFFARVATSLTTFNGDLYAEESLSWDVFGQAISVGEDYVLIGAPNEASCGDEACATAGAAYVYERAAVAAAAATAAATRLVPDDTVAGLFFGRSVCVVKDFGFIGAKDKVYVYNLTSASLLHTIVAVVATAAAAPNFAASLACRRASTDLYDHAAILLVGAPDTDECLDGSVNRSGCHSTGAVTSVVVTAAGYNVVRTLRPTVVSARFGSEISFGGQYALIGSDNDRSAVHVAVDEREGSGQLSINTTLAPPATATATATAASLFGHSLSIDANSSLACIGDPAANEVYCYDIFDSFAHVTTISSDVAATAAVGASVAVVGDQIVVVGAPAYSSTCVAGDIFDVVPLVSRVSCQRRGAALVYDVADRAAPSLVSLLLQGVGSRKLDEFGTNVAAVVVDYDETTTTAAAAAATATATVLVAAPYGSGGCSRSSDFASSFLSCRDVGTGVVAVYSIEDVVVIDVDGDTDGEEEEEEGEGEEEEEEEATSDGGSADADDAESESSSISLTDGSLSSYVIISIIIVVPLLACAVGALVAARAGRRRRQRGGDVASARSLRGGSVTVATSSRSMRRSSRVSRVSRRHPTSPTTATSFRPI